MKSWPDVIYRFIDFLKKPTGAGIFLLTAVLGAAVILAPWVILGRQLDLTIRETSAQQIATMNKIVDILNNKRIVDKGE